MNRAMLLPNPLKDKGLGITENVLKTLAREGFEVFMSNDFSDLFSGGAAKDVRFLSEEKAAEGCDFIIVIGGDGSILRASQLASRFERPILGINAGTLGFMSELEPSELDLIGSVKAGNFTLDRRSMLDIFSQDEQGNESFCAGALNDAVIGKGVSSKTIGLSVAVDGEPTLDFSGDGLIVSTPTGSTAYSLASGGPVLAPQSPCIALIPICPHSLSAKSLVVDDGSEILVKTGSNLTLFLSADGHDYQPLVPGDAVKIRKSKRSVGLIRIKGTGFYERIRIKLAN